MLKISFFCTYFLCSIFSFSYALEDKNSFTVTGKITLEKFNDFSTVIKQKKIDTVIFKDCHGGNALAGYRFAEKIKQNRIDTVASGEVASSCALAFLGGNTRRIDDKNSGNFIAFHSLFRYKDSQPWNAKENKEYLDLFSKLTNYKFSQKVEEIIINTKKAQEGIFFVRLFMNGQLMDFTFYCDGKQEGPLDFMKCERRDDITLQSENIISK